MAIGKKDFSAVKTTLKTQGKAETALQGYLKGRPEIVLAYLCSTAD
jgi:hypothetical protein